MKKHLFSDTDTDYAMTEVSWLRESSRKPKPKVTKYSKSVPVKPKALSTHTSCRLFKPLNNAAHNFKVIILRLNVDVMV